MAEPAIERSSSEDEKKKNKDDVTDPEFFSCVLQPSPADSDPNYIGIRRLLLHRKAQSGVLRRKVRLYAYMYPYMYICVTVIVLDPCLDSKN